MIGRRSPLVTLGASLLAAISVVLSLFVLSAEAVGPGAPNQMKLDATAGGSVDASRSVSGTAAFSVGIHVTQIESNYGGYQWQIEFPTAGIAFVAGSAVENTAGTGLDICSTPSSSAGVVNPGTGTTVGGGSGCITFAAPSTFVGQTTTLSLQCVADGTWQVLLHDVVQAVSPSDQFGAYGSAVSDSGGTILDTGTTGITITCSETGVTPPTSTPTATATSTFTPGPPTPTNTPCAPNCPTAVPTLPPDFTRTPTPTATRTVAAGSETPAPTAPASGGTPAPGGGTPGGTGAPGGTINGPDTGSGGLADSSSGSAGPRAALAVAILPMVLILGVLWSMTSSRRES